MSRRRLSLSGALLALGCWPVAGCGEPAAEAPAAKPPEVVVAHPVVREDAPALQFTGRTEAIHQVAVKARVSGYLEKVAFADGTVVKAGDLLFQIDPRPYQATLAQAEAAAARAKAALAKAQADMNRAQELVPSGAITPQEYDLRVSVRDSTAAELGAANAQVEAARLDLEFTTIKAPIAGRIGQAKVTKGNLISAAEGAVLTTIVQLNPIYVSFDVDERSMLAVRDAQAAEGKKFKSGDVSADKMPFEVGLAGEEGFPHEGFLDFVDNRLDPVSHTLKVRGVVDEPNSPLVPGLFVRVRVRTGKPRPTTFVAERALGIDQGQRFVYVVDDDNKVQYKAVTAGGSQGGLRRIDSELPEDAWVVVSGVQRVRPGLAVAPQRAEMVDFVSSSAGAGGSASANERGGTR